MKINNEDNIDKINNVNNLDSVDKNESNESNESNELTQNIRLRRIGWEKTSNISKNFDEIYDHWKNKALELHKYIGKLHLIKEHNKVFFFIEINIDNQNPNQYWIPENNPDHLNHEDDFFNNYE